METYHSRFDHTHQRVRALTFTHQEPRQKCSWQEASKPRSRDVDKAGLHITVAALVSDRQGRLL